MSSLYKWICLLAFVALAACVPATADLPTPTAPASPATPVPVKATPAPTSPAAPADAVIITYHRTGGIAGVNETWIFHANGRVEHAGRGTGHAAQLSASQLEAVLAAARAPEVAALNESYVPANSCCDRFTHEITLALDGQTKTVTTLDGAPDQPPALTNLLDAINAALR